MQGKLVYRRLWLIAAGVVLCLLAAAFAYQAKLAWYSPAGSPFAGISATKLRPTDAPKLIAQALAASSAAQDFPAEAALLLALALLAIKVSLSFCGPVRDRLKLQVFSSFSPPLFRRPPPQS